MSHNQLKSATQLIYFYILTIYIYNFYFFSRIAVLISVSQFFPVLRLLGSRFSVLLPSLMPKISRMFSFTGATMKYQVRPTSFIFYEKKYSLRSCKLYEKKQFIKNEILRNPTNFSVFFFLLKKYYSRTCKPHEILLI